MKILAFFTRWNINKSVSILSILFILFGMNCSRFPETNRIPGNLVWPEPPDSPKIRFINSFSSPDELGIKPSWFEELQKFIGGKEEEKIRIVSPYNIYVDKKGVVYVTDTFTRSIHIFDRTLKEYRELRGVENQFFYSPIGIAADFWERVYVSDSILKKVFVFEKTGKHLYTIESEEFLRPTGIAIDQNLEILYVVDTLDHKIKIFNLEGEFIESIGRRGSNPGEFNFPTCIFVDKESRIYVGDTMNFRVQIFNENGDYLTSFGQIGDGSGYFSNIKGLAVDSKGHVYITDAQFDVVQIFDFEGNFLLTIGEPGTDFGQFNLPLGIFVDGYDNIYVADKLNKRIQVFTYFEENK